MNESNNHLVHVENVIKNFQGPAGVIHVLKGIHLTVQPSEFVGVRGPSGSGKSTLVNMITGIDRPTSGSVKVAGEPIEKMSENQLARFRGKHIGVIFQFFQLLPTLTVVENVMLPMDFCRVWKPRERPERAMNLLEQVGLADQAHKLPNTLSGGQQQRAAIARALANDPPLLVADEPTGNLDSKTGEEIMQVFEKIHDAGNTIILVTHEEYIAKHSGRIIRLRDGLVESDVSV
jgi:putative ABC transport system ATP-binding protein